MTGITPRLVRGIIAMICAFGCSQPAESQCSQQAHNTAEKLLRVVYEGAFIGGSESAFKESLNLTMDDGDPPSDPVVVIKGYTITAESQVKNECHVTVVFDRVGSITIDDFVFHAKREKETASMWVLCNQGECKVDMDAKRYGLPSHVGKQGILAWLESFRSGGMPAKVAALEKKISAL